MRIVMLIVGLLMFAGGFLAGLSQRRPCDFTELLRGVGEVQAKCEQLAASRCMNITTPVLNVSVYDTPNLGAKR